MLPALFAWGCNTPTVSEPPPAFYNILWITAEDLSPRLGCYGDTLANTPNIDRLAAEGIRYTNVYSVSGVCAPSRAAIITGLYPTSFGAQHMRTMKRTASLDQITDPALLAIPTYEAVPPPDVKCFPVYLRAAGYYCTNNAKTDYQFAPPLTAWDESSNQAHWRGRPPGSPSSLSSTSASPTSRRYGRGPTSRSASIPPMCRCRLIIRIPRSSGTIWPATILTLH